MVKLYTPEGIHEYACPNCGCGKIKETWPVTAVRVVDKVFVNDGKPLLAVVLHDQVVETNPKTLFQCAGCFAAVKATSWEEIVELIREEGVKSDG